MSRHRAPGPPADHDLEPDLVATLQVQLRAAGVGHMAGLPVTHGCAVHPFRARQRCAWCGTILVDETPEFADVPADRIEFIEDALGKRAEVHAWQPGSVVAFTESGDLVQLADTSNSCVELEAGPL